MSHFFAEFDLCGVSPVVIRKDTRVYFHPQTYSPSLQQTKQCVGVVWMCNPGSAARPTGPVPWGAIPPDPTLQAVYDLYKKAVALKTNLGDAPGSEDYLKILNCYYAVDPDHEAAYKAWRLGGCRYKEKIPKKAAFVLAAWGKGKPQGPVYQAISRIKGRAKKSGSKSFVVYVDVLPGGSPLISHSLASMNYPAHPLSSQFKSSVAALAKLL